MGSSLKLIGDVIVDNRDLIKQNIDSLLYNKKHYIDNDLPYKTNINEMEELMKNMHKSKCTIENEEEKKKNYFSTIKKENDSYLAKIPILKESILKDLNTIRIEYFSE